MKKYLSTICFLSLTLTTSVCGQQIFNATWNIGFPTGDTKDFLIDEDVSLGGAGMEFRHFVQDNLSIGGSVAWDFFNGSAGENTTIPFENGDVTGFQRNVLNYIPIMVNSHYYAGEIEGIRPYVGAGLGAVRTLQRTSIGTFGINNDNWHFGIYPEIGVLIPVLNGNNILFAAKYNVAFETDDSITYSYFSLNLGFSFSAY